MIPLLYVSKPFSSTNINNLQAKAKLYGLNPAAPQGCPHSELGYPCGAISSHKRCKYYPEATFTGIDLSGVLVLTWQ